MKLFMSLRSSQPFIAFNTLLIKEMQRFLRIWIQTLLPSVITTILYFLIFGYLIGQRIGEMQGVPYLQYIAPGLIMMAIITNAYSNVSSSFFSARFTRSIEELLVSPMQNSLILWGYVSGGILRGIAVGFAVGIVAALFADFPFHSVWITVLFALLTSTLFSLAGFTNGIFARKFDDISIVPTFILTPLTYLGGVFYSIQLLPEFWRGLSALNPILYMVNGFRYGLLGITDISIWIAVSMLCLFIALLTTLNLWLLNRGVGIRT